MARGVEASAPLHDVLAPGGPQAAHILSLWHLTLGVCTLVFVAVLAAFLVALVRGRRGRTGGEMGPPDLRSLAAPERGPHRGVASGVVASTLLLVFLIVASVLTDRALARLSTRDALQLQVTANQWWWEVRYDGAPADTFTTANEIHVPVGRPVVVTL